MTTHDPRRTYVGPPRNARRWNVHRDWPLAGAAISAVLCFAMLFPPWLSSQAGSEDAFGPHMQAAGPALIIVVTLATLFCVGMAMTLADRRYLIAAFLSSMILLIIYIIKVADVSDLADLYHQISGLPIDTGGGVWAGFIFSLLTLLFLLLALGLKWGMGETLTYPIIVTTAQEPKRDDAQPTGSSPPSPEGSSDSTQEPPSR